MQKQKKKKKKQKNKKRKKCIKVVASVFICQMFILQGQYISSQTAEKNCLKDHAKSMSVYMIMVK